MKIITIIISIFGSGFILNGCYVYSAFQNARTLDEGEISATPSVSFVSFHNDGESEAMTNNFGVQLGVGLPKVVDRNLNLTIRYETLRISEEWDEGYHYADFGLKFGIIPDRLAIGLPIGLFFGDNVEESEAWQLHPSIFITVPIHQIIDINMSAKYLVFFDGDADNLIALNGGVGFNLNDKMSLLPEMGVLFNPNENGLFFNFGMGVKIGI